MGVVGGNQRDGAAGAADPGDDRGEDVGELRAEGEESFPVEFGRGDRQQGDQLAGVRGPVLDQAVVRELCQFLDPEPVWRSTSMAAQAQNALASS